jgi:hypothetical protein
LKCTTPPAIVQTTIAQKLTLRHDDAVALGVYVAPPTVAPTGELDV